MLKVHWYFILFFVANLQLEPNAQVEVDSLIQELSNIQEDSSKVYLLLDIHNHFIPKNPDSATFYLKQATEISEKVGSEDLLMYCEYTKGRNHLFKREFDKASTSLSGVIEKAVKFKEYDLAYKASNILTTVYWRQGNLNNAVEQGLKSLEYEDDESKHAILFNNLGGIFEEMDDDSTALEYYGKSLDLHREAMDSLMISGTVGNIGVIHYNLGNYTKALDNLTESIELLRPYNHKFNLSIRLQNLGNVYRKMENYEEALSYFLEGYTLSEELNDDYGMSSIASNLSETYGLMGRLDKSADFAEIAETKAEAVNSLQLLVDAVYFKAQASYNNRNYKDAFDLQSSFVDLKDSLLNAEKFRIVQDLESKYQRANQEIKIQKQQAEIDKKTVQRNYFIIAALLLSLLAGLAIFLLRYRIRKNRQIHEQDHLIQKQKIKDMEKEKKILTLAAMIEGQETERTRIAKDLHDGLGGLLSTVKAHFNVIQEKIQELEKINVYNKTNNFIDQAVEEVRRISHNLMPGALRLGGLNSAVEEIAESLKSAHKYRVDLEINGLDERLEENIEVFIYRVIQEAVNNIVKHAETDHVFLQISKFDEEVSIVIEDNGKGFDVSNATESKGIGLKSMQSRVEYLGGNFDILSNPGKGTTISINIPLKTKEK